MDSKLLDAKSQARDWRWLAIFVVFGLAIVLTDAHFMGDTADYVDSIVAYQNGRDYWFWEFGHVLWRPLGWLTMVVLKPLTSLSVGSDVRSNALYAVIILNWLAGLVSVLSLYGILKRLVQPWWIVAVSTVGFIFTHGFLNYTQTGCSYVPGVAFLLLALYALVRAGHDGSRQTAWGVLAGVSLAGALSMWVPLLLGLPAILLAPFLITANKRGTWKAILIAAVVGGLLTGLVYLSVMIWGVGITDISGVRAWMQKTAGGPAQDKSLQRMVFGLVRSFLYMGNDGMLFKRYLVGDPYSVVTAVDLFRLSLWKIGLFYLFAASLVSSFLFAQTTRRVLAFLALSAIPILALAAFWQGGDIERYFALYPALFVSIGLGLMAVSKRVAIAKYIILAFVGIMVLNNGISMARFVLNRKQEATAVRAQVLQPLLKPTSRVFAVTFQDDFVNFNRSFPFHPVNRVSFNPYAIVAVGTTQTEMWRKDFASKAEETWTQGGDVWVSKRVFSPRPQSDWNWVEGDDKNVSWADINAFFSQLEFGTEVGGEDGFALLNPSDKNRAVFATLRQP